MGVAVEHIFNEIAMHAKAHASNRVAKANKASHGPRVRAQARVKKTMETSKEIQRNHKGEGAKGLHRKNIEKWSLRS